MTSDDRKNMLLQISDLCPKYDYIRKRKSNAIISKTEMEEFKAVLEYILLLGTFPHEYFKI